MSKPVIIEPEAEADARQAYDWYERQRAGLGDDFLLCVEAGLNAIGERPRSFPKVRKNTRRALIHRFPYLLLFVEQARAIVVVGLFHTSRSPQSWNARLR